MRRLWKVAGRGRALFGASLALLFLAIWLVTSAAALHPLSARTAPVLPRPVAQEIPKPQRGDSQRDAHEQYSGLDG